MHRSNEDGNITLFCLFRKLRLQLREYAAFSRQCEMSFTALGSSINLEVEMRSSELANVLCMTLIIVASE